MRTEIRARSVSLPDALRAYIRQRLWIALGRFGTAIRTVDARLADVNGPKGGVDIVCRIEARVRGRAPLVVEALAAEPRQAVDRAVDRASRAVGRAVERRDDRPRLAWRSS